VAVAAGNTPSKLNFTIKVVRQREIPKVDVVIDFSPAPAVGNELLEQILLATLRNSTRAPPLSDTEKTDSSIRRITGGRCGNWVRNWNCRKLTFPAIWSTIATLAQKKEHPRTFQGVLRHSRLSATN